MYEHLSLQDLIQTRLVHKAKVGNGNIYVCKTIGKDKNIISKE